MEGAKRRLSMTPLVMICLPLDWAFLTLAQGTQYSNSTRKTDKSIGISYLIKSMISRPDFWTIDNLSRLLKSSYKGIKIHPSKGLLNCYKNHSNRLNNKLLFNSLRIMREKWAFLIPPIINTKIISRELKELSNISITINLSRKTKTPLNPY